MSGHPKYASTYSERWRLEDPGTYDNLIAAAEARGAAPWRELAEQLALALNCLPSTFPDAYGHVFEQIASLRNEGAALAIEQCRQLAVDYAGTLEANGQNYAAISLRELLRRIKAELEG